MPEVFLVGGAVRDIVMKITPKDLDFVVVGSTPQEMIDAGFTQVGADFPVFLHPVTKDEFALARTERKVGSGYNGFTCEWQGVTLEEDLSRRDLTMNAMALPVPSWILRSEDFGRGALVASVTVGSWTGELIDPFGGKKDIEEKVIRHVGPAFEEDPVRVLRIARFLARFGSDWKVAPETIELCKEIFRKGELKALTAERVWKEMSRALMELHAPEFFWALKGLDLFPELDALEGVEQRADHHPEVDTFLHVMLCLKEAVKANLTLEERFAVLCHDLGKRPAFDLLNGNLHGHEEMGVPLVETFCDRLKAPNECRELAKIVTEHHTRCHRVFDQKAKSVMKTLEVTDAIRKPDRFQSFLKCCEADARGRTGFENRSYTQVQFMQEALKAAMSVDTKFISTELVERRKARAIELGVPDERPVGPAIGEAIRVARISAIRKRLKEIFATFKTDDEETE